MVTPGDTLATPTSSQNNRVNVNSTPNTPHGPIKLSLVNRQQQSPSVPQSRVSVRSLFFVCKSMSSCMNMHVQIFLLYVFVYIVAADPQNNTPKE